MRNRSANVIHTGMTTITNLKLGRVEIFGLLNRFSVIL